MDLVHALEAAGLVLTPLLSFAGAWGGIKARLAAMNENIKSRFEAVDQRIDGIDARMDRQDRDIRDVWRAARTK